LRWGKNKGKKSTNQKTKNIKILFFIINTYNIHSTKRGTKKVLAESIDLPSYVRVHYPITLYTKSGIANRLLDMIMTDSTSRASFNEIGKKSRTPESASI
jgi:hypothetical protein